MMLSHLWSALALSLAMLAQQPVSAEEKVYPALEEPLHKVVFHNEYIDVYDVKIAPGERSFFHRHTRDQLGISMRSINAFNETLGSSETPTRTARGSVSFIPHSVTGGYIHRVRTGEDPFRVIGIEFAQPAPSGTTNRVLGAGDDELVFPQGALSRVTLAPGAMQEISASLLIANSSGKLKIGEAPTWNFGEGDPKWIASPGQVTAVSNSGSAEISLYALRLNTK